MENFQFKKLEVFQKSVRNQILNVWNFQWDLFHVPRSNYKGAYILALTTNWLTLFEFSLHNWLANLFVWFEVLQLLRTHVW